MASDSIDDLLSDWGDDDDDEAVSNRPAPPSARSSKPVFDDDSDDVDLTGLADTIDDDDNMEPITEIRQDDADLGDLDDSELPMPDLDMMATKPQVDSGQDGEDLPTPDFNADDYLQDADDEDALVKKMEDAAGKAEDVDFDSLDLPSLPDSQIDSIDLKDVDEGGHDVPDRSDHGQDWATDDPSDGEDDDADDDVDAPQDEEFTPNDDQARPHMGPSPKPVGGDHRLKGKARPKTKTGRRRHKFNARSLLNVPFRLLSKVRKARRMYWVASSLAGVFVLLWSFLNVGVAANKGGAVEDAVNEGSVEVVEAGREGDHVKVGLRNKSEMIAHVAGRADVKTWSPDYRPASWVAPRVVESCSIPQEDIDPGKTVSVKATDCKGKVHGVWPRVQVRLEYQ